MSLRRTYLGLAVHALGLSVAPAIAIEPSKLPKKTAPPPAPEVTRMHSRPSGTVPHQNLREAARRAGGQVWKDYQNASRAARGLPPL